MGCRSPALPQRFLRAHRQPSSRHGLRRPRDQTAWPERPPLPPAAAANALRAASDATNASTPGDPFYPTRPGRSRLPPGPQRQRALSRKPPRPTTRGHRPLNLRTDARFVPATSNRHHGRRGSPAHQRSLGRGTGTRVRTPRTAAPPQLRRQSLGALQGGDPGDPAAADTCTGVTVRPATAPHPRRRHRRHRSPRSSSH